MSVRKIGILTSGGDCAGVNAAVRAVVEVGTGELGLEVLGVRDGFHGLLTPPRILPLGPGAVHGSALRAGSILGTSTRGNPFAWTDAPGQEPVDRSQELVAGARALGLDGVVVIGGDGSLAIARDLAAKGLPVVGVPKTIDNDIARTDLSFGFDTAVATATDAIDKLHAAAESHHRILVVEVSGRDVGWVALTSGIAGGADVILIPELPLRIEAVAAKIEERVQSGQRFSIVVVAEGVSLDGRQTFVDPQGRRLGGIGERVASELATATGRETRCSVLGHIQRGGAPTPFDRVLATRFGAAAARLAAVEGFGRMVALRGTAIQDVAIVDAVAHAKRVPADGELARTALGLGVSLGS